MSAGNAQLAFFEIEPLQFRVNRKDGLHIAPFEGSFSTDDPSKDVVRIFALRLIRIVENTNYNSLIPDSLWIASAFENTVRRESEEAKESD